MEHRFISVHYQLYSVKDGERTLEEQTIREKPFQFISGFGVSLEALENQILPLEKGSGFDFTLTPAEAFGEYEPQGVHKLEREVFTVNGKFDSENIYQGAIITLCDSEDHHFPARVVKLEADGVTVDTNHPMAGKTLNFTGEMIENRPATEAEINSLIKQMTGGCGGCGKHCGDGEGCGEGCCGEGDCNEDKHCGHCH